MSARGLARLAPVALVLVAGLTACGGSDDSAPPTSSQGATTDGDTVAVGELTLNVRHCPGHTPGHVVFHHPESKLAIVGDVLFQGSIGRTDLPGCDHAALMASIQTLLDTLPDDTGVLPGHMDPTTLGQERRSNPFLQELAGR